MRTKEEITQDHANALAEFGRLTFTRDELPRLIDAQSTRIRQLRAEYEEAVAAETQPEPQAETPAAEVVKEQTSVEGTP